MLPVSHPDTVGIPRDSADITRTLHAPLSVTATLETVLTIGTVHLGADGASVVRPATSADSPVLATGELFRRLEFAQLRTDGGGPAAAVLGAGPISMDRCLVPDTAAVTAGAAWADWCRQATMAGVRSVLTLRLHTHRDTFGALTFYCRSPHRFGPDQVALATDFAGHAGIALATAKTEEELRTAIKGRHGVALALGILMERFGLTEQHALDLLHRYSDENHTDVPRLARQLVLSRGRSGKPLEAC